MTEALQLEIRTLHALLDSERDPAGRAFAPLADAYRRAGKIPDALKILRAGIAKHPDFATGHVVAAQLYVEQGLAHEGALAARRALELDAENVIALKSLLRALDETGETREAEEVRSALTSLEPDFAPDWTVATPLPKAVAPHEATTLELPAMRSEPSHPPPALAPGPDDIPTLEAPPMGVGLGAGETIDLDLMDFGSSGEEAGADRPTLGTAVDEPVMELSLIDPEPTIEERVMELVDLAPEPTDETPMEVGAPAPEVVEEPVMELVDLAPDSTDEEPAIDQVALAPAPTEEEPSMDVSALARDADETAVDLAALAPDMVEEPVMELADLAPDASEEEPVMDLASLAPDPTEDEPVVDLASLAPDPDESVVDLAALAPQDVEEPIYELAMLSPTAIPVGEPVARAVEAPPARLIPDDEPVFDLDALAPGPDPAPPSPATGTANGQMSADEAVEVGFLSPDEPEAIVIDLDELLPEDSATSTAASSAPSPMTLSVASAEAPPPALVEPPASVELPTDPEEPPEDQGEPIYTRTLAELYAAQGASKQALRVLRHLLSENPRDADLSRRIAEVESGTPRPPAVEEPEEEVDTLARDLAESGRGGPDRDSPFNWSPPDAEASASAGGPTIREYFEGLLEWEPPENA